MTLRSTARSAFYLAHDGWGCLRRFLDGKAVNGYDDHMAEVLADREALVEVSEPDADAADERLADCGLGGGFAIQIEDGYPEGSIFRSGGQTSEMGPRPKLSVARPPSAADEPAFTAWLASIDARLAAIQDQLTSAAPGARFTPDAAPESPAPDPGAGAGQPDWCAAEMRQVADILLTAALLGAVATPDSQFVLGYANDLRSAAEEIEHRK